jgi:hypothetical protein
MNACVFIFLQHLLVGIPGHELEKIVAAVDAEAPQHCGLLDYKVACCPMSSIAAALSIE